MRAFVTKLLTSRVLQFKWRSCLAGGRLSRCLRKCHQSLGQPVKRDAPSQRLPSGSHEDRSSWLDPAGNSKLFALRIGSAGTFLRLLTERKCHRNSGENRTSFRDAVSNLVGQSQILLTKIMQLMEGQTRASETCLLEEIRFEEKIVGWSSL